MTQTALLRASAENLRGQTQRVFAALGLSPAAAGAVSAGLVDADMRGIASHGLLLVPMYVDRLRAGSVTSADRAEILVDFGAIALLDARSAMGILTADQAMAIAIEKAAVYGIGAVSVRRAFHFGAAFRYVHAAARAGFIGIAAANTRPLMPAPGGARAVVGNNPLAIGVPTDGEPVILDMALSEVALGKIRLAAQEGRDIPQTWATDNDGIPTTDPNAAIAGLLLPAGGPKGYGLALMLDVLTGVLSGGGFGAQVQGLYADTAIANDCAHVFVAIKPAAFGNLDTFTARMGELSSQVLTSPLAPGVERVRLPGQIQAEAYDEAVRLGVPIAASVMQQLTNTAASLGIDLAITLR